MHHAFYLVGAYGVPNKRSIISEEDLLSPVATAGMVVSSRQCGRHVQRLSHPTLQKPLPAPGPCINQQMISGRWPTLPTGLSCLSSSFMPLHLHSPLRICLPFGTGSSSSACACACACACADTGAHACRSAYGCGSSCSCFCFCFYFCFRCFLLRI